MGDAAETEPLYLSREEAARLHGITPPTLDRWIRDGGDAFVAEHGGNGRAYRIDAAKLKNWREGRLSEEAEAERLRQHRLHQLTLEFIGGDDMGAQAGLTPDQRLKLRQEQLLTDKLRRERGELVEVGRAEMAYQSRMKLVSDFLRGLPDVLGRKLAWDAETILICAETIEGIQERLARSMMEERFVGPSQQ